MKDTPVSITEDSLNSMKDAMGKAVDANQLSKTFAQSTGLVGYSLQAPSKHLIPWLSPLRNCVKRRQIVNAGTAENWKVLRGYVGSGFDTMGGVPEGRRSGVASADVVPAVASYVTIGEEDAVTFEAQNASRGFEDANATASQLVLKKLMVKEEHTILGGNNSLSLGTPTAPSLSVNNNGGTIGAGTYDVIVVALSYAGYWNSSVANGVATTKTVTGADGFTYTKKGGSSLPSVASSTVTTTGTKNAITATAPIVNGSCGYAWYVGTVGAEKLVAITTLNTVVITALNSGGQAATAITADNSKDALEFDGFLTAGFKNGADGNAYVVNLPTVEGTGTALTASGRGTVVEIDTMLQAMWDRFRVSPTIIWVAAQQLKDITAKCLTGASASPLLQLKQDASAAPFRLSAGGTIGWYFNPFANGGEGAEIPVKLHPTLPNGTLMGVTENLPEYYQSNHAGSR